MAPSSRRAPDTWPTGCGPSSPLQTAGTDDLSHFTSTASWMAGTAGPGRSTGWLGRWLDTQPGATGGLRGVAIGTSVPLHLVGQQAVVTSLDTDGDLSAPTVPSLTW